MHAVVLALGFAEFALWTVSLQHIIGEFAEE